MRPPEATFRVLSVKSLNDRTQIEIECIVSMRMAHGGELSLHAREIVDQFELHEMKPGDLWKGTFVKVAT